MDATAPQPAARFIRPLAVLVLGALLLTQTGCCGLIARLRCHACCGGCHGGGCGFDDGCAEGGGCHDGVCCARPWFPRIGLLLCCRPHLLEHLKCHIREKCAAEEDNEQPFEFPRFHPVPVRPVFAPRDLHGVPLEPDQVGPMAEIREQEETQLETPPAEELLPPPPLSAADKTAPTKKPVRSHPSWVFQKAPPKALVVPARNARPNFAEPAKPAPMTARRR